MAGYDFLLQARLCVCLHFLRGPVLQEQGSRGVFIFAALGGQVLKLFLFGLGCTRSAFPAKSLKAQVVVLPPAVLERLSF